VGVAASPSTRVTAADIEQVFRAVRSSRGMENAPLHIYKRLEHGKCQR
jgi:hypothetical protein